MDISDKTQNLLTKKRIATYSGINFLFILMADIIYTSVLARLY